MGASDTDDREGSSSTRIRDTAELKRNLAAYWLLGLCNNYSYVIMLSAAHDILSEDFQGNGTKVTPDITAASNSSRDCNPVSTGTILLADILPSLIMKLTVPFMLSHTRLRVLCVIMLSSLSFLFVSLSQTQLQAFIGVICAATGGGLGEVTFLQYSARYHKNVVSTWSSGTGGSGVFGALSYAALTAAGVSPRKTVLLMLIVPAVMGVTFFLLLDHDHKSKSIHRESIGDEAPLLGSTETERRGRRMSLRDTLTLRAKFKIVPKLVHFMVPLGLVYLFEYFINQGLFELIYIRGIWLDHHAQYRWFQVTYQLGVFISRSSVNCFKIETIWILAFLQFVNVVLLMTEAVFLYLPSIWIVFGIVLWEGLVAGSAYVNTFYSISHKVDESDRAFAMGITSLASSLGISVAGFLSVPTHQWLCSLP